MLADHDLDVDTEVTFEADEFDDATDAVGLLVGEVEHLDGDHHAVHVGQLFDLDLTLADAVWIDMRGRDFHSCGNLDPLANLLIVGDDKVAAIGDAELADHDLVGALEDAVDLATDAAIGANATKADQDTIAMHSALRAVLIDEDVAFHAGWFDVEDDKAEAIAVHAQGAGGELAGLAGELEGVAAELNQQPFGGQTLDPAFDFLSADALGAELAGDLLQGAATVGEAFEVG